MNYLLLILHLKPVIDHSFGSKKNYIILLIQFVGTFLGQQLQHGHMRHPLRGVGVRGIEGAAHTPSAARGATSYTATDWRGCALGTVATATQQTLVRAQGMGRCKAEDQLNNDLQGKQHARGVVFIADIDAECAWPKMFAQ